jgi:hypothetical protein
MAKYLGAVVFAFLSAAPGACGQHPGSDEFAGEFFLKPDRAAAAAAAQMAAPCDPMAAAVVRLAAFDFDLWNEPPPLLDRVPQLSPARLGGVRDDTWFGRFDHAMPEEVPKEARDEDWVYWQAVFFAWRLPAQVFAKESAENRFLTFGHLYEEPAKYRGKVVHVEGRLLRLKRLDPPLHVQLRGLKVLHEAWIALDRPTGAHPVCVIVAHPPEGIEPGEDLNRRVTADGYFFKRYRYISGRMDKAGNNQVLNTLLIISPTLAAQATRAPVESSAGLPVLWPWAAGFGSLVGVLLAWMIWWMRRSDRRVRARLAAVRAHAAESRDSPEPPLA